MRINNNKIQLLYNKVIYVVKNQLEQYYHKMETKAIEKCKKM